MASLVSDDHKIPVIVERLIVAIETHGMFTVGVYRKSGATAKVKQLKQNIDSGKEGEWVTALDCLKSPAVCSSKWMDGRCLHDPSANFFKKIVCLPAQDPMIKKYRTQDFSHKFGT